MTNNPYVCLVQSLEIVDILFGVMAGANITRFEQFICVLMMCLLSICTVPLFTRCFQVFRLLLHESR